MRIGLYGGSFDPVHLGHLLVAQAAYEEMQLDRVIFIPAQQSPFKPGRQLAPPNYRLRWLHLALAGRTYSEVDSQELERGGVSYTIDTVREFQKRFPDSELFYLIGADHVSQLPKWREAAALAASVQFVVIPRPGEPNVQLPEPFRGTHLRGFPIAVSSSELRERMRVGLPVDLLTGPAVAASIKESLAYSASDR